MTITLRIADSDATASPELSQKAKRDPDRTKPTAENRRRGATPVDDVVGEAETDGTPSGTAGAIPAAGAIAEAYPFSPSARITQLSGLEKLRAVEDRELASEP